MRQTAKYLLRAPDFELSSGPVQIDFDGENITSVSITEAGGDALIMPALVNAHDHGYGISTLGAGIADDALECWIPGLIRRPDVDPKLEAMVAFGRMALSGIGTTVHCHNSLKRGNLAAEAAAVASAARHVGIRVAFSCPIADRNPVIYGNAAELAKLGYPSSQAQGSARIFPDGAEQVKNALAVRDAQHSDWFNVQLGPVGPQWCTDQTLQLIAQVSQESGLRVHMHFLETERQREWLDHTYDNDPVRWLDKIGLLSERLTIAHGVWLRPDESERLAERGVIVAVNASSNLRLRSGMAPVPEFRQCGLRTAIGLDGSGFDDDQDMLREIRLFKRLHSGMGLTDELPAHVALRHATSDAYGVFDGSTNYGTLTEGLAADFLVIDTERVLADVIGDDAQIVDMVLARASADDVSHLVVGGRAVIRDGELTGFDFAEASRELLDQARTQRRSHASPVTASEQAIEAIRAFYLKRLHVRD